MSQLFFPDIIYRKTINLSVKSFFSLRCWKIFLFRLPLKSSLNKLSSAGKRQNNKLYYLMWPYIFFLSLSFSLFLSLLSHRHQSAGKCYSWKKNHLLLSSFFLSLRTENIHLVKFTRRNSIIKSVGNALEKCYLAHKEWSRHKGSSIVSVIHTILMHS